MDAQQAALALGPKSSPFDAPPPNPSLVTTITRVWHVAMGHPKWVFKMHGKFIAELQECDEAHAERIAAMKATWPALADLQNGQTLDIYPRVKAQWIDDEYKPKNRILVSFETVPMSEIDERNLYLQKSTKLYKDAELTAQQCIDINHQTGTITPAAAQYEARVKAVEEIMAKRNEPTPAPDETVAVAETAQWEALGKLEPEAPKHVHPEHWIDDDRNRKQLMGWLNGLLDDELRKAPKGDWRKTWLTKQLGVSSGHIHDYMDTFANYQKEAWTVIQRFDAAKTTIVKLLLASGIKITPDLWPNLFDGQQSFWDTVASGADLPTIEAKIDAYITAAKNAPKNAEPATTPDNPPSSNAAPANAVYQGKSENSTTSPKGIPMVQTIQVIEGTLEMSAAELPCAEYPFVTLLSMWKYGKEFKHTVRGVSAGNLADRVEAMIDEFTRRGYTLNPTQTAPMPQAPLAFPQQNTAPANDAPAPQTTVEGGQVETICQVIMHSKDTAKGKEVTYDLMPMLGNGKVGQYRVVTLRNQRDLNMLTAAGVRLEEIKPELPYPVNLKCTWKNGKEFEPGKFYRDLVSLEPIAA